MNREIEVRVTVRRSYGGGDSLEWGMAETVDVGSATELQEKLDGMTDIINQWMDHHEQSRGNKRAHGGQPAPPVSSVSPVQPESTGSALTTEHCALSYMVISENDRGRLVKLAGGRYSRFGVTLYPELWGTVPGAEEKKPGRYPLAGNMTIELEDGKPRRVLGVKLHG